MHGACSIMIIGYHTHAALGSTRDGYKPLVATQQRSPPTANRSSPSLASPPGLTTSKILELPNSQQNLPQPGQPTCCTTTL
ncbi:hypothetical protein ElyMa_003175100 [Elysia marginata]|uniref:Uncharacterized protein n=1 Tax=Elysia marginata TaxID=1093978 RepID=A0AAV4IWM7_9GAST|nr:hypothetical protein ElyMa_003175100 [Elysia marginata]